MWAGFGKLVFAVLVFVVVWFAFMSMLAGGMAS